MLVIAVVWFVAVGGTGDGTAASPFGSRVPAPPHQTVAVVAVVAATPTTTAAVRPSAGAHGPGF